jgi:hypothetical protein
MDFTAIGAIRDLSRRKFSKKGGGDIVRKHFGGLLNSALFALFATTLRLPLSV